MRFIPIFLCLVFPSFLYAQTWSVQELNGAPCLYKDAQPAAPVMFWQWELQEQDVRDMSRVGINLFSMFGSFPHYANPYWKKDGSFGMNYQDAHIQKLLQWNPDCYILPRIFSAAPDWWVKKNPAENIAYSKPGFKPPTPRESFASQKLREEAGPVYRQAIRHLMNEYGNHLLGIHVTNGPWGEHFSWDAYYGMAGGDVSEPMRQAFSAFLRKKYNNDVKQLQTAFHDDSVTFENVQVPPLEKRRQLSDGSWRDPAQFRWVTDYFECHNAVTVDLIDFYCRIVTEITSEKVVAQNADRFSISLKKFQTVIFLME